MDLGTGQDKGQFVSQEGRIPDGVKGWLNGVQWVKNLVWKDGNRGHVRKLRCHSCHGRSYENAFI